MNDYSAGEGSPALIQVDHEFSRCPECGYGDGFHVSFAAHEGTRAEVILICPRCSKRYQTGWETTLA